ncbi:Restriction endonuclease-like superfamily protein [Babesia bovis T2Bo]|uniref:Membrane protein, putative n=1 Tax=Babesia bovis TaxID=5865 RepID=A7ANY3_BABBO|nr:Restriction endonuclease-like superfamily protein [Babesia bovis T2Bo]EDO08267.1 Restriction endonuclease-like superfamily protein [Babesia bovis T2Bo]|eukprot:XP_001611835.1 membrane protein [Babesia bovis T2Bo]
MCSCKYNIQAMIQLWALFDMFGCTFMLMCICELLYSFSTFTKSRLYRGRPALFLCALCLCIYYYSGRYGRVPLIIGWSNHVSALTLEGTLRHPKLLLRSHYVKVPWAHLNFINSTYYRGGKLKWKDNLVSFASKSDNTNTNKQNGKDKSISGTEIPNKPKQRKPSIGFKIKRKPSDSEFVSPKIIKKPLTVADVIKKRMIPQPPSLNETQKVLDRKPYKRLGIPKLIKEEQERICKNDAFLDKYFHDYLTSKGTHSDMNGGITEISPNLFSDKTERQTSTDNDTNEASGNSYVYSAEELLHIWDTKGSQFYTNIPKTVALLQIIRRIAKESDASIDIIKRIRDHWCFGRLIGSVVRHMKYLSRIELPQQLIGYKKLENMVPKFSKEEMVSIFAVLDYFRYKNDKAVTAMVKYTEQYKDFTTSEIITIMGSCIRLGISPPNIIEEYVKRLKVEIKEKLGNDDHEANDFKNYAYILHICTKTQFIDAELFKYIAEHCKKQNDIEIKQLYHAFSSFAKLQHIDEDLFQHIYRLLLPYVKDFTNKYEVYKLISRIAMTNSKPPKELIDALANWVYQNVQQFTPRELATMIRNLAVKDYYNDNLYNHIFNLEMFINPPSVKLLQHINLHMNQSESVYASYLQPLRKSELNIAFSMAYQAYLGYQYLSPNINKIEIPKDAVVKLRNIYVDGIKQLALNTSANNIEIVDLLKEAYGIEAYVDYTTEDGLMVDVAILPSSLTKHTTKIDAKDFLMDKRFAIEFHGPYHHMQRSTDQFPPPLTPSFLYKERLLNARGWEVARLHYWTFVPWLTKEHKLRILECMLPTWIKNVCNISGESHDTNQIAPSVE